MVGIDRRSRSQPSRDHRNHYSPVLHVDVRTVTVKVRIVVRILGAAVLVVGLVLTAIGLLVVPAVALGGVAFGMLAGVVVAVSSPQGKSAESGADTGSTILGAQGRRAGVLVAASTAAGWLVAVGLVVLMGAASGIVFLAAVATGLVAWLWRRPGPAPPRAPPGPAVDVPSPPVTRTTSELCAAWQRSYFAMLDIPAGPRRWELVRIREDLLDELERRDHDGFARWLDSGARAGSDPSPFLATDRPASGG